ncbi:MAG: NADP-dependent oxidoreductase, partial [Gammaproteobacteria bacterium]
DEVYSYGRRDSVQGGTFADLVALPAPIVSRKPAGLTWEQAAGLPLAGMAAQRTLDTFDLPAVAAAGGTLLIHNGSGGVGQAAIQIAAHAGKRLRILATASPSHHDRLRELGAEPVEYGDGLVERVRDLVPDGVDAVADFVGGVLQQTLAVLRSGGQHASLADNTVTEHGGRYVWVRPDSKELDRLSALVDAGQLTVAVARTWPLQKLANAFSESREGHTSGKLVLTPFTD